MSLFEKALANSPPGNDEAILHWNACARLITRIEQSGTAAAEGDRNPPSATTPPR
jgi:hypothetical protein